MRSPACLLCFLVPALFLSGCNGGDSLGASVVDRPTPAGSWPNTLKRSYWSALNVPNSNNLAIDFKPRCRRKLIRNHLKNYPLSPTSKAITGGQGKSGLAGLQLEPDCREELQASQNVKTLQQTEGSKFRPLENSPGAQPAEPNLTTLTTTTIWHPQEPPLLNDTLRLAQSFSCFLDQQVHAVVCWIPLRAPGALGVRGLRIPCPTRGV